VADQAASAASETSPLSPPESGDKLLVEVRPSWWRFFWHLVFFWLIVPPIIAAVRRASVALRVYPGRVNVERGLFSKSYREFLARDIRSIDIDQSMIARMVGIGDITLSTAATVDAAERIQGISDPHGLRELILAQRETREAPGGQ
jgi:uncharacterized membrane protein YdbT with pleckstrin-like domain